MKEYATKVLSHLRISLDKLKWSDASCVSH